MGDKVKDIQVIRMLDNLSALENEGLSYGIMEGYIKEGTFDNELDNAIKQARIHLETVSSKLNSFEEDLEKGKYDEYIE